ncbi:MAG: hypothetical protein H6740_24105 [Alphaproteobacteria bacterium]|nr:hypothetical protein [Alphaproteobacteria bacterium]
MKKERTPPTGIDDVLDVDASQGRYDGPEVIEDPAEVAKRMRRRSNMESAARPEGERKRKAARKSTMDDIFGS